MNTANLGILKNIEKIISRIVLFFSSTLFLYIVFVFFIAQAVFFALTIKFGIPPDENYHLSYIKFFSEISPSPFPSEQNGYYILREAIHNPFIIYHYLLSFPYLSFSLLDNSYIYLRIVNVMLASGTFLVLVKIASVLKISPLARNLSLFMLTNTLMFTFLSGSINYDNLFIFLSSLLILLFLEILKKISALKLLLFINILLLGSLSKINFIPVAFIVIVLFALRYHKKYAKLIKKFVTSFHDQKKINIILVVLFILLSGIFSQRYIYNLVSYHRIAPSCPTIHQLEDCRKSELFVRNEMIYSEPRRTLKKDISNYAQDWPNIISERTFGIFAHKVITPDKLIVDFFKVLLIATLAITIFQWKKLDNKLKIILAIIIFYSLVVFIINIKNYYSTGRFSFAVHGRYLFATLPLLYLFVNNQIVSVLKKEYLKLVYILLVLIIFFLSGMPLFVQESTQEWFS